MSPASISGPRLVADVGGTNTRVALVDASASDLHHLHCYLNRDFPSLEALLQRWLADTGVAMPAHSCLAIAAHSSGDQVRMENIDWSFSRRELAANLGLQQVRWLNDFEANAYALPHLGESELHCINQGAQGAARLAVMGPGTGLGGAVLDRATGQAITMEPGFAGLSPGNEEELELFRRLLSRDGAIYSELLVSGPGLLRLYRTLAEVRGQAADLSSPEAVSLAASNHNDALAQATLDCFTGLLGSCCGDFVVSSGSFGGLYLAGGIIPGMLTLLENGPFLRRFTDKGGMARYLKQVPVSAIIAPFPGLLGAATAPLWDARPEISP